MVKRQNGLLLIGGASRNVGKTTLICQIIERFSGNHSIIGLKIKTITDSDAYFHGKQADRIFDKYTLNEEILSETKEDTGKMLKAGAQQSFLLRTKAEFIDEAFQYFLSKIDTQNLIVCESNSLRKYVKPDLYLLIKGNSEVNMKPSAKEMESYADKIIFSDGIKHHFNLQDLKINNTNWILTNTVI